MGVFWRIIRAFVKVMDHCKKVNGRFMEVLGIVLWGHYESVL